MKLSLTLNKIIELLDGFAPFSLAESWDHSGLRLGSLNDTIHAIAVCLDASAAAVREASKLGCDLLLTHHPLMFSPQENMICDRLDTKAIAEAFSLKVDIVSCHTNFDSARGGVNDVLASLAGLSDVEPLIPSEDPRGFGMGAIGNARNKDCASLCESIARSWGLSGYRTFGGSPFNGRTALCGGAGGDLWKTGVQKGATLYITADLRYDECLEARDAGLNVMVCDHGEMENAALPSFTEKVRELTGLPVHYMDLVTLRRQTEEWHSITV